MIVDDRDESYFDALDELRADDLHLERDLEQEPEPSEPPVGDSGQAPAPARLLLRLPEAAWDIEPLRRLAADRGQPPTRPARGCHGVVEALLGAEHWTVDKDGRWDLDATGVEWLRDQGARIRLAFAALGVPCLIAFENGEGGAPELEGHALTPTASIVGGAPGALRLSSESSLFEEAVSSQGRRAYLEAQAGLLAWTRQLADIHPARALAWEPAAPSWAACEWDGQGALAGLARAGWPDSAPATRLAQIVGAAMAREPAELGLGRAAFQAWCVSVARSAASAPWRAAIFAEIALSRHPELAFELSSGASSFFDLPLSKEAPRRFGHGLDAELTELEIQQLFAHAERSWLGAQSVVALGGRARERRPRRAL